MSNKVLRVGLVGWKEAQDERGDTQLEGRPHAPGQEARLDARLESALRPRLRRGTERAREVAGESLWTHK